MAPIRHKNNTNIPSWDTTMWSKSGESYPMLPCCLFFKSYCGEIEAVAQFSYPVFGLFSLKSRLRNEV